MPSSGSQVRAHPPTGRRGALLPFTGCTHSVQARPHPLPVVDPSAEPAPSAGGAAGEVPELVTPETLPASCSVFLQCPATLAPTLDTSACLFIRKQGRRAGGIAKESPTQRGPAIRPPALTPAEGTQQGGAAQAAAARGGNRGPSRSQCLLPPRPRCRSVGLGLHRREEGRAPPGRLAGTGQRRGGDSGTSAGQHAAHTQALSPHRRRRPWPRCWSQSPGQPRAPRPKQWRHRAGRRRGTRVPR